MRLELARDAELNKRKGLAWRTIVASLWLAVTIVSAYLLTGWLIENEIISVNFFYNKLMIPLTIEPGTIRIAMTAMIVIGLQFFILIGYGLVSPAGRHRPGNPSARAKDIDPLDKFYYR